MMAASTGTTQEVLEESRKMLLALNRVTTKLEIYIQTLQSAVEKKGENSGRNGTS